MGTLVDVSPTLCKEIDGALVESGDSALAKLIFEQPVHRCTFGDDYDVGYIYFERKPYPIPSVHNEAAPVKYTISFNEIHDFVVDIDHEGNPFGIELIGRADILAEMRSWIAEVKP